MAYNLSHELFDFCIEAKPYFDKELPFFTETSGNQDLYANFCLTHLSLLKWRCSQVNSSQLQKDFEKSLMYHSEISQYVRLADLLNSHLFAEDFSQSFIEEYDNRFQIIDEVFKDIWPELTLQKLKKIGENESLKRQKKWIREQKKKNKANNSSQDIEPPECQDISSFAVTQFLPFHLSLLDSLDSCLFNRRLPDMDLERGAQAVGDKLFPETSLELSSDLVKPRLNGSLKGLYKVGAYFLTERTHLESLSDASLLEHRIRWGMDMHRGKAIKQ